MKIPTLIGIALITALVVSFGIWFFSRQEKQIYQEVKVTDLQVANITDTTATVVWQSSIQAVGSVLYGESNTLGKEAFDNRDTKEASLRTIHFVTLKNLQPNKKYYFRVKNDQTFFPEEVMGFSTANIGEIDELNFSFIKPIKGTILNTNLNPIDESLIFINIPGAQKLVTFSSTSGNFIMPLKLVLNENLDQVFDIAPETNATLTVKKGSLQSTANILITDSSVNLPPITIGNNLDLSNYVQPPIKTISIGQDLKQNNYDFNGDGIVNSLDLAILRGQISDSTNLSDEEQSRFDINSDGIVDQKDVDQFSRSLVN